MGELNKYRQAELEYLASDSEHLLKPEGTHRVCYEISRNLIALKLNNLKKRGVHSMGGKKKTVTSALIRTPHTTWEQRFRKIAGMSPRQFSNIQRESKKFEINIELLVDEAEV